MSWPTNPALDDDRWDVPLLENLDALKEAIGSPTAVASQGARLTTAEGTIAGQGAAIAANTTNVTSVQKRQTSSQRGLMAPNPGEARLFPLPSVIASPLTPTTGAQNTSAISGSNSYPTNPNMVVWNDGRLRVLGPALIQSPSESQCGRPNSRAVGYWVEFMHEGRYLEVAFRGAGNAAAHRLMADGQWVTSGYAGGVAGGVGTDGGIYYTKYDFGSRALRSIRLLLAGFGSNDVADWRGIKVEAIDSVWLPHTPRGPKVVVFGDSWTYAQVTTWKGYGYGFILGQLMGWRDLIVTGIPGTGFVATSGGTQPSFAQRIVADCLTYSPDIILIMGGLNDGGLSGVGAAATALWAQIKTALPNCILIFAGSQNGGGQTSAQVMTNHLELKAAAQASPDLNLYIDPIVATVAGTSSAGWMTGTGKTTSLQGNGNSDTFIEASNHPTDAGHAYFAHRLAQAIAAAMPILGAT